MTTRLKIKHKPRKPHTHHGSFFQFFRENPQPLLLHAFVVDGVALQIAENKQIAVLEAVQIGLLHGQALLHAPPAVVGAAGGHDAAKHEENVPQQKGDKLKAIVSHAAAGVLLLRGATVSITVTTAVIFEKSTNDAGVQSFRCDLLLHQDCRRHYDT